MKNPLFILTAAIIISLNTICCFAGDPRFEPPIVAEEINSDECGFSFEIRSDVGVDAAATEVTVITSGGNDLTDTLEINTYTFNNKKKALIHVEADPDLASGRYTVIVTAKNIYGIATEPQVRVVTVICHWGCRWTTTCNIEPRRLYIDDKSVEIEWECAFFSDDFDPWVTFTCPEITIDDFSAIDWHTMKLGISIDTPLEEKKCNISINGEHCNAEYITLIPFKRTDCFDYDRDGYYIPLHDNATCGIVDCNDKNSLMSPGDTEVCNDGLDNDCDGAVDCDDGNCTDEPECISEEPEEKDNLTIIPGDINAGIFLPRLYVVNFSADTTCPLSKDSLISFYGDEIKIIYQSKTVQNSIIALVFVEGGAAAGTYDVTIGDCGRGEITIN